MERGRKVHPFCTGLIVDVTQNAVDVTQNAVTLLGIKGVVGFSDFTDASGSSLSCRTFRVGGRFYNTAEALMNARIFRPK